MSFSIEIAGIEPLLAALEHYEQIAQPIVRQATDAALLSLIPDLADYPAQEATSTYRRTGTLGRLWGTAKPEWQPIASGFEGTLGNATPYGPWVQDRELQATQHKGRWQTDKQVVDTHAVDIQQYYDAALQDVADAIDKAAQ